MRKEILATGKDVEVAVQNALDALGVTALEDISYEIVDLGSKGIFGIGARPTKVRAWIDMPDTVAPRQHGNVIVSPRKEEKEESDHKPTQNAGQKKSRNNRRRKNGGKRQGGSSLNDFVPPTEPSTPREAVIPESELKMEPVTVKEGEDLAFDFVKQLVAHLGIDAEVALFHCEDNSRRITITGEEASMLIGHHGEALDSLQYLANLASTKKNAEGGRDRRRVTIDIEGYRAKREETLRALARKMAAKALRNHRNVMLEPMSAYERRIIHSEIQGIEGVATNSIGSDNNRKIVIYLTDAKKAVAEEPQDVEETVELPGEVLDTVAEETVSAETEDATV
ncbi:MAG: KH domain-containing protein [Ruminococcaceae bacterium]|nr:KH domain-containing protein [Oscillospiraceae bacterium]